MRRRALGGHLAHVAALAGVPASVACAGAGGQPGAGRGAGLLLVANVRDGTVSRLDLVSGRPAGAPLPAGPAPAQLAAGPGGTLLALPAGGPDLRLTHVVTAGASAAARTIALESGSGGARLTGDGRGAAALVYHLPADTRTGRRPVGRLALLDVARGEVQRTHTVCAEPDVLVDVALDSGPPGPVAYLAVWGPPVLLDGRWRPVNGRVLAIDAQTGARLGGAAVPEAPAQLRLTRAPGDTGRLLYCLMGGPGPDGDPGAASDLLAAGPRRLLGLDPITLQPEREHTLPYPVRALAASPDGDAAYALAAAGRREVVRIDLRTGVARSLATLPVAGSDLVATEGRVYVADGRAAVWVLDAHSGALVQTLAVGRSPVGLALSVPV